ncbi:NAD-dependent epimerase/dehydratase family protein [Rhodococcus fascians]|uniref:NAD-dependent epimerase/dehydratase family protein n=1 Tax=Rhodococcoides fascians TaxID=1828 RepID=UPI001C5FEE59|nr:NAD-dependent epimerase/dehydratase family protein [Rhodococcus fascians]MBW4780767.1 NAD-dependent epimerase/dehydratase family protein [Rhodococcus fascians]
MKVIVTGCAGFIGSTLCEHLLRRDDVSSVIGIDSLTDYYSRDLKLRNLSLLQDDRFHFVQEDLLTANLAELMVGVDYVFHQAGQPGVRSSWGTEFDMYVERNVSATQRLLEAAKHSKTLKRLVYASSSSVYGDAETFPTSESTRPAPLSPYGVTKLSAEHLCVLYAKNFDVPTVSLRYFTVYGPRQRPDMLFTRIMMAAHGHWDLELYGTGDQVRDFTYVDDIVQANMLAALGPVEAGAVFNVSGGSNVSVNDVLHIVNSLAPSPLSFKSGDKVKGDVVRTGGDSSLIHSSIGWEPKTSISDGLATMYRYYADLSL